MPEPGSGLVGAGRLRRPSRFELALQVVLALLALLFVSEFIDAYRSSACGRPGAADGCYPWGSEGPVAGGWAYQSQTHYLVTIARWAGFFFLAAWVPFVLGGRSQSFLAIGILWIATVVIGVVIRGLMP